MRRFRFALAVALALAIATGVLLGATTRASAGKVDRVVVAPGAKVQIAVTVSNEFGPSYPQGIGNAVAVAVAMHPTIRGFPIQLNTIVANTCLAPAGDAAVAAGIVENSQNTGVIGPFCSSAARYSLPVYEGAGIVTISGSATADDLPALAPTVFDRTLMDGPDGSSAHDWFTTVIGLPSVVSWNQYHAAFPPSAPTTEFDAFAFDAATLLIDRLQEVSKLTDGNLVIERKALAKAVRSTTDFDGVTCTITLDAATGNRLDDQASLARCGG